MTRGALAIAACVNLQSLTIRLSESRLGQSLFPLFDELLDFGLRLPFLRHISFFFLLGLNSMEFIERHSEQLEFLSIYMAGDEIGRQFVCSRELCNSFSIPLPISTIHCSPLLTPIFVPRSCITDVSLYWPCRPLGRDAPPHVAKDIIVPLTQSGRPVIVLAYASQVWHTEFMALAAAQLRELQYLRIDNCTHVLDDVDTGHVRIISYKSMRRIVLIADSLRSPCSVLCSPSCPTFCLLSSPSKSFFYITAFTAYDKSLYQHTSSS